MASWSSNGSGADLSYSTTGNPPGSLQGDALYHLDTWVVGAATACFAVSPSFQYSAGMEFRHLSGSATVIYRGYL